MLISSAQVRFLCALIVCVSCFACKSYDQRSSSREQSQKSATDQKENKTPSVQPTEVHSNDVTSVSQIDPINNLSILLEKDMTLSEAQLAQLKVLDLEGDKAKAQINERCPEMKQIVELQIQNSQALAALEIQTSGTSGPEPFSLALDTLLETFCFRIPSAGP